MLPSPSERGRAAAYAARSAGMSAMECAGIQMDIEFSRWANHWEFKERVRKFIGGRTQVFLGTKGERLLARWERRYRRQRHEVAA